MNKHENTIIIREHHQDIPNVNADLEELILAYVFFYIKSEYFQPILDIVNENHFFFRENQIVFLALKEAMKQDMPLHPKTIRYLLNPADFARFADPDSDTNNGLEKYFTKLMSNVELGVFHLDIEKLCLKLKDLSLRRALDIYLNEAQRQNKNPKKSTVDVHDYITSSIAQISKNQFLEKSSDRLESILEGAYDRLLLAHKSESKGMPESEGVPTGYRQLDAILGGFRNGELILLGARPSMGKTSLALNITLLVAKKLQERRLRNSLQESKAPSNKQNILFFSLEMSPKSIGDRITALESDVNLAKMVCGSLKDDDFQKIEKYLQAVQKIKDLNIYIDSVPSHNINSIRRKANSVAMAGGISMIVFDYLGLLRSSELKKENRVQEITVIGQGLKSLARELNVPVIALSQLSRKPEGRENTRPRLCDLRDSGSLEQDADIVLMLYREEYYLNQQQPRDPDDPTTAWYQKMQECKGIADLMVLKNRNGATGNIKMRFEPESMKFYELEKDRE